MHEQDCLELYGFLKNLRSNKVKKFFSFLAFKYYSLLINTKNAENFNEYLQKHYNYEHYINFIKNNLAKFNILDYTFYVKDENIDVKKLWDFIEEVEKNKKLAEEIFFSDKELKAIYKNIDQFFSDYYSYLELRKLKDNFKNYLENLKKNFFDLGTDNKNEKSKKKKLSKNSEGEKKEEIKKDIEVIKSELKKIREENKNDNVVIALSPLEVPFYEGSKALFTIMAIAIVIGIVIYILIIISAIFLAIIIILLILNYKKIKRFLQLLIIKGKINYRTTYDFINSFNNDILRKLVEIKGYEIDNDTGKVYLKSKNHLLKIYFQELFSKYVKKYKFIIDAFPNILRKDYILISFFFPTKEELEKSFQKINPFKDSSQ